MVKSEVNCAEINSVYMSEDDLLPNIVLMTNGFLVVDMKSYLPSEGFRD